MSAARQFDLLEQLLLHPRLTAQELADRLGVSERTIYRDVEVLSAAGVPLCACPGKGGGFALLEHYLPDRALLTPQEQCRLVSALKEMTGPEGEPSLAKLRLLFRPQDPDWLAVEPGLWTSPRHKARFELLRQAIVERHQVVFDFLDPAGIPAGRRVLPARLVCQGGMWSLQGYCLEEEDYSLFPLSRITCLEDTGDVFHRPLTPPALEEQAALPPLFRVTAHLRFSPAAAPRLLDELDGESPVVPLADGSLLVTLVCPQGSWLLSYLLSFGPQVEVLSPQWLSDALTQAGADIARGGGT